MQQVLSRANHSNRQICRVDLAHFLVVDYLAILAQGQIQGVDAILAGAALNGHAVVAQSADGLDRLIGDGVNDALADGVFELGATAVDLAIDGPLDGIGVATGF